MKDFYGDFCANVKHYREERGWNQSQLAVQANSSNGMIGNIEAGKARPSFSNILAISAALGVHPADLFLRDASRVQDRPEFSRYIDVVRALDAMPRKISEPICKMICEIASRRHRR